jgi:hypothetical protein
MVLAQQPGWCGPKLSVQSCICCALIMLLNHRALFPLVFGIVVCLGIGQDAMAGRPLATEDAGVLGKSECELESFAARNRSADSDTAATLSTQIGCGFGFGSQLQLAIARQSAADERTHTLTLGGKTQLIDRPDDGLALTLAWGIVSLRPAGGSFKHETTGLNLALSQQLSSSLTGHANLGAVRTQNPKQSSMTWNLALEYAVVAGLDLMAETYGQEREKPWAGVAARYAIRERVFVDASLAQQAGPSKAKLLTVGARLGF